MGKHLLLVLAALVTRAHAQDCERVAVWKAGVQVGSPCRAEVNTQRLTVIDLGEQWTPAALAAGPSDEPGYRAAYLALAQERFTDAGLDGKLAASDRYLELYGIAPTLDVVRRRLADDVRHACHEAAGELPDISTRITEETADDARGYLRQLRALRATRKPSARLSVLEDRIAAIRVVQAKLACDGLFDHPPLDGGYTWQTSTAVERFQRGAMILPDGVLGADTRAALRETSRERDFRTALRVLRERVAAATGWIEDGSAGSTEATVLGRVLIPMATLHVRGYEPLEGAAPDLLSAATEAAATALGWTDPIATRASLDALASGTSRLIGVELPAPPAYHAATMQLAVEIDRGDVWHDATPRRRDIARRPALIVYAVTPERKIPLVRWPTTIGGWQRQKIDGDVAKRWKESPAGARIWREMYVGPRWLPPRSTPDRELVRGSNGHYELAREQLGPSYRAAFGMVAFIHQLAEQRRGTTVYEDQGIRTHGTGNLVSLANGVSHGCHRLLGYHVMRLSQFVLLHRPHVRHGETATYYRRTLHVGNDAPRIAIDSLGYRIELEPPIEVTVLPGRVH
jgi:hypothetical protein